MYYQFIRPTRKYNSYKGEIGKIADNIIDRDFFALEPLKKCYTDVTQFKVGEDKSLFSTYNWWI